MQGERADSARTRTHCPESYYAKGEATESACTSTHTIRNTGQRNILPVLYQLRTLCGTLNAIVYVIASYDTASLRSIDPNGNRSSTKQK